MNCIVIVEYYNNIYYMSVVQVRLYYYYCLNIFCSFIIVIDKEDIGKIELKLGLYCKVFFNEKYL